MRRDEWIGDAQAEAREPHGHEDRAPSAKEIL